jgi:hypothetical protein
MNYNLRSQNYSYFVRYQNGIPYIYYGDFVAGSSVNCGDIQLVYPCYTYGYNPILTQGWAPSNCDYGKIHYSPLPVNNYLYPQSKNPPSGAYSVLCGANYNVSISNKIKITIPDDPIFSGVYVFDYLPGSGNSNLRSPDWILNQSESAHNLITYNHPDSIFNNKLLVSLNDNLSNQIGYEGYLELKTSYYNDENNTQARQLEDAYAFPAKFVFTAVQPPCPCSGIPGLDYISTIGSGHRLAVGLSPPIRWRHPYSNWILVDKVNHVIDGYIPNYATGTLFSDGTNSPYYSSQTQQTVLLNNSKYIKYTESYVTGTAETQIGSGYVSLSMNNIWPVCTGLSDIGFAFRSSASGLGIDRGLSYYFDGYTIEGIGREQEYVRDVVNNFDFIIKDERPFFDTKIPVRANIEFVYSCRSGLPCFNMNGSTITPISGSGISCNPISSYIDIDYLCGENEQAYPPDSYWTTNNITSTQIVFSGLSGINPIIMKTFGLNDNSTFTYDAYVDYSVNPIINIPFTGYLPSQIRNFLTSKFNAVSFLRTTGNVYLTDSIRNYYSNLDLYWNVNMPSQTAKVYVTADEINLNYPILVVSGAGNSEFNGTYFINVATNDYNNYQQYFYKSFNGNINRVIQIDSSWYMQKYNQNKWVSYYMTSGVSILGSPTTKNKLIQSNWMTGICLSGISPTPISIGYY